MCFFCSTPIIVSRGVVAWEEIKKSKGGRNVKVQLVQVTITGQQLRLRTYEHLHKASLNSYGRLFSFFVKGTFGPGTLATKVRFSMSAFAGI